MEMLVVPTYRSNEEVLLCEQSCLKCFAMQALPISSEGISERRKNYFGNFLVL